MTDWPTDDTVAFAAATTPAERLEWLESALDFAHAAGALEKTWWLESQDAISTSRSDKS